MKKNLLLVLLMIMPFAALYAQSPESFTYQCVVRDANGDIVPDQQVSFRLSIVAGSVSGTVVYSETHDVTTNTFALANLVVGTGTVISGDISSVDWGSDIYFFRVEADITGASSYVDMGTVQLLSVPYALYSKSAGNSFSGNYNDLTNKPLLSGDVNGQIDGNTVSAIQGMDISTNIPANGQVLKWNNVSQIWEPSDDQLGAAGTTDGVVTRASFSGAGTKTLTLMRSNGLGDITAVFTDLVDDADANPANELQNLSISGNNLSISGGNTVSLPQNVYTAGMGIDIQNNEISNSQPDQTVVITGTGATTVTGTYPAFTVSSTDNVNDADADPANELQSLSLTGNTLSLTGGGAVLLSGYVDTLWKSNGTKIYNSNQGNVGVGINDPVGKMVVKGDANLADTIPLFEVKDRTGATVFVVYPDSVRIFVGDDGTKTSKGAFAVSGRNTAKAFTNNYLLVSPDSSRIWTGDADAGFGVKNINGNQKESYMKMNPNNYLIGHHAGNSISTGLYNSFIGFEAGYNNSIGSKNYFIGYKAGYHNDNGMSNIFVGDSTGYNNTWGSNNVQIGNESGLNGNGSYNIFIGTNSGYSNNLGSNNCFIGYNAGAKNYNGSQNIYFGNNAGPNTSLSSAQNNICIGNWSGSSLLAGSRNIFIGLNAGMYTTSGISNTAVGENSLKSNTTGNSNTAFGSRSLEANLTGFCNVALGEYSCWNNTTGKANTSAGASALRDNTIGNDNSAVGSWALIKNQTGNENVSFGIYSLAFNISGSSNTAIGSYAGYNGSSGAGNVFIGYQAGYNETGSNKLYIANTQTNPPLIYGDFSAKSIGFGTISPFSPGATGNVVQLTASEYPQYLLEASSASLNNKVWRFIARYDGSAQIQTLNDAYSSEQTIIGMLRDGSVFMPSVYNITVGATNRDLYIDNTGKLGYLSSSAKYKTNINEMENVEWLYLLKPVNYNYISDDTRRKEYGLIAEDVEKVNPHFVSYNISGSVETVSYSALITPMLKAIQDQKKKLDEQDEAIEILKKEIAALKSKYAEIAKLKEDVERINQVMKASAEK
jgi:hypothetical protein